MDVCIGKKQVLFTFLFSSRLWITHSRKPLKTGYFPQGSKCWQWLFRNLVCVCVSTVTRDCSPRFWEVEVGLSWDQCQSGLQSESVFQKWEKQAKKKNWLVCSLWEFKSLDFPGILHTLKQKKEFSLTLNEFSSSESSGSRCVCAGVGEQAASWRLPHPSKARLWHSEAGSHQSS